MYTQQSPQQIIACFSCSDPYSESLLESPYFQQLLTSDLILIDDPALRLCGNHTTSFSLFNNMEQTFRKIKQKFYLAKDISSGNFECFRKESDSWDIETLRMDILKFFHIFLANLRKLNLTHHNQKVDFSTFSSENNHLKNIIMQLVGEIKHLLMYVGRISSIFDINTVNDFSSDSSKRAFNYFHFCHLCLDIWFNCLTMLYIIHFSVPVDFKESFCVFTKQSNAYLQVAEFLVYDLFVLSVNRYMNSNLQNNSPFLCSCVKDLWIMVVKLCDNFNWQDDRHIFWNIFLSDLQQIIPKKTSQDVKDLYIDKFSAVNINTACSDSTKIIQSCFWLTSYVTASLNKYDSEHTCQKEKTSDGSIVGKCLIEHLLSDPVSEKHFPNCLSHILELSELWEANTEILSPLTDFYFKNIDKIFSVQEINLCLFKDAKSWFAYIENLSNLTESNMKTSFDYILGILSLQLQRARDDSLWRFLKGRIYSKFMPKKFKEMKEIGLQNTFTLFHVIVMSRRPEIVDKICEAASIIETLANPRKQQISWKALFVLLYINRAKKYDSGKVINLLSKFFNSVCTDYCKISCDSVFKNNLMNLLLVYIDSINELFKSSDGFSFSTYQLISSGFSVLLKSCSLSDRNYILRVIQNIVENIQQITESYKIDIVISNTECIRTLQLIFENIYPFIENVATSETAPLAIADIAVILTKLSLTFASSINRNSLDFDYYKIFMFFACKDNVNSNITCHYLCLILDYPQITEEIKSVDLDVLLFQSWLKCLINVEMKNSELQKLTKKIFQLPTVNKLVPSFRINFESENTIDMACALFQAIGNDFSYLNSSEKTNQARKVQTIFKNYASISVNKIYKGKDVPTLSHVYRLTSLLIENCSSVLHYRVYSESILLQILDKIVYPQILFTKDKTLQNQASYAIKDYLPHFIRGLLKLDYRNDKSIEREIRNIFIYYIGVLPLSKNPLINLLTNCFSQNPGELDLDACLFILETLKSSLLSNSVENPNSIFQFYQEIFQNTPKAYKCDIINIILRSAMEIFVGRNDSLGEFLKVQIKKVLLYFRDKSMLSQSKEILKPVIKWFVQDKLQWSIIRGFVILDLFVDHVPQVMLDLIEFLKRSIETLERNRGLGEDKLLRTGFQNLISKLQSQLKLSQADFVFI